MDEKEFERAASEALRKLEAALRDAADELDVDLAGEILTLEFDDGTKYVANSHSAAQQIWLSANLAAWHFAWDGAQWKDTRTGKELFAELGRLVSEKLAQPLALRD